jgi:uncharacterized protein YbaR (Trm112 family)
MKKDGNENKEISSYSHFRSVNGKYIPINNCPRCKGAVLKYQSWPIFDSLNGLFQCLQCGRIYRQDENGIFELWVRKATPAEVRGMVRHRYKRLSKRPLRW